MLTFNHMQYIYSYINHSVVTLTINHSVMVTVNQSVTLTVNHLVTLTSRYVNGYVIK